MRPALVALALAALLAPAAPAEPGRRLHVSLGPFDDDPGSSDVLMLEDRRADRWVGPARGLWQLAVTTDGAAYLGAGLHHDLGLGRRLVFTPSFGMGVYHQGSDKDLGHVLQFRLGAEVGVRLGKGWRAAFLYHHLSNASLSEVNPGAESFLLSLSRPFGRR